LNTILRRWRDLPRDPDETLFDREAVGDRGARAATLAEVLPILRGPETGATLSQRGDVLACEDGRTYPIINGRPVLMRDAALRRLQMGEAIEPPDASGDALDQYLYLNQVKNAGGDPNSPLADPWYRRHLHRSRRLLAEAQGLILDVGCDDPALSRQLFPAGVDYLGLEPALGRNPGMRLVAMAEFLPLQAASVDGVAFLTSLDHVFDYHAAIDEAFRVLKPGGALYLGVLIWTHRAELYRDNIHFHHFRDFEIQGVLQSFQVERIDAYGWKGDAHRFGAYLRARKPRA